MLKIELTDPHLMTKDALMETAVYLMRLAGSADPIAHMPHVEVIVPARTPVTQEYLDKWAERIGDGSNSAPSWPNVAGDNGSVLCDNGTGYAPIHNTVIPTPVTDVIPPVTVISTTSTDIELDVNGLPWDGRIHTRTRSKTLDGVWKLQRGIDFKKVEQITKELTAVMAIPRQPAIVITGQTDVIEEVLEHKPVAVPPPPALKLPTFSGTGTPLTIPPADPIDPCPADFDTFIGKIAKYIATGKLNHFMVKEVCEKRGIASLPLVASRPDLIPEIAAEIDAMMLLKK